MVKGSFWEMKDIGLFKKGFPKRVTEDSIKGMTRLESLLFDQVKRGPLKPGSKRLKLLRKLLNVYGLGGCSRWGGSERGQRRRGHSIRISDCSRWINGSK